jgi:glycosyltransferase involved in cell wall biosynthesis
MRILMTTDCVGGVWTYALELARALAPRGYEVHLATMGPAPDTEQRRALASSAVVALHESEYALEWEDDPWQDVDRAGEWLLELSNRLRPDVVHLNGYVHASLPWPAPVVVAAHSDVVSWWRAVKATALPPRIETYRERVQSGLEAAEAVCGPTHAALADLRESFAFGTPCVVVPNGRSAPAPSRADKEPLIAGLGRFWDEAKNVAALERVAPRLPWPVVLGGSGTRAGRLGPADASALLARASIFASPVRYEPFGLASLEAAHGGCALVLGDLPSLREVWGDAALYVPPDDEEALAAALGVLCRDTARRRALAAAAGLRARRYTPAAMAAAQQALYERLPARVAA